MAERSAIFLHAYHTLFSPTDFNDRKSTMNRNTLCKMIAIKKISSFDPTIHGGSVGSSIGTKTEDGFTF